MHEGQPWMDSDPIPWVISLTQDAQGKGRQYSHAFLHGVAIPASNLKGIKGTKGIQMMSYGAAAGQKGTNPGQHDTEMGARL
jgi:hypothetical protein